jgi:ABC-2 type transport system permease protein
VTGRGALVGLIASEWLRARSRRLVKVLAVVALLGIALAIVIGAVQSQRPDAAQLARAERQAQRFVTECIAEHGFGALEPGDDVESFCAEQGDPSVYLDGSQMLLADLPTILRGVSFIAILIGLVIGASSVGASWQSGTMTTILTWEPRRVRVALVRAAVVSVTVFALVAILLGVFVAAFWLAASLRGVTTTPDGWGAEVAGVVIRVSALAAAASIIGGAIAMVGRNTAAALGGVFVYLTVFEGVLRGLRPGLGRYLLGDNIAAVLSPDGLRIEGTILTPTRGALMVAVYTLALWIVATVSFRMRDVQ